MGGIDQRSSPDDFDEGGHPTFTTVEGLYPSQDGLLSRVPGKSMLALLSGEVILTIFQPFDSTGNILVQTDQNLYAYTLDELLGRIYTPTITASAGTEDEGMSIAILSHRLANAVNGGPIGTFATQTLTTTGAISNAETALVNGKTYTFQSVLTNVDGHVFIAGTTALTLVNFFHAINASGGTPGTDYAAATVANTVVTATNPSATTVTVQAILPGTVGNAYTTTDTMVNASWGSGTLAGGVDAVVDTFYIRTLNTMEVNQNSIVTDFSSNGFTLGVGTYRITATIIWNPVDAGAAIIGTTIGLYNNTSAAFEVYDGGTEPILGSAGKASAVGLTESLNIPLTIEAVFSVAAPSVYTIRQKGSVQAGVRGSNFCGINDQCSTNSNVNGSKSNNYYALVKILKQ